MIIAKRKLFWLITVIELIFIAGIGIFIAKKYDNHNVLGVKVVEPLPSGLFVTKPNEQLKYYYELIPNNVFKDNSSMVNYPVTYTINSDGLNDRFNYETDKNSGVFRIVTLGESFTFGDKVNTKDNWSEVLENDLNNLKCNNINKFEVINLGVSGFDVPYITYRFADKGKKYNPDLIIWLESGSGYYRFNELRVPYEKEFEKTITPEQVLKYKDQGNYWPTWTMADDEVRKNYSQSDLDNMIGAYWKAFFEERGNARVLIAGLPSIESSERKLTERRISGQEGITAFYDLPDIRNPGMHIPDGHPSMDGHKLIAENIAKYLVKNNYFSCTVN